MRLTHNELTKFKKPNHRFGLSLIYLRKIEKVMKKRRRVKKEEYFGKVE